MSSRFLKINLEFATETIKRVKGEDIFWRTIEHPRTKKTLFYNPLTNEKSWSKPEGFISTLENFSSIRERKKIIFDEVDQFMNGCTLTSSRNIEEDIENVMTTGAISSPNSQPLQHRNRHPPQNNHVFVQNNKNSYSRRDQKTKNQHYLLINVTETSSPTMIHIGERESFSSATTTTPINNQRKFNHENEIPPQFKKRHPGTRTSKKQNKKISVSVNENNNYTFVIEGKFGENQIRLGSASYVRDMNDNFTCVLTSATCVTYKREGSSKIKKMDLVRIRIPFAHVYNGHRNFARYGMVDVRFRTIVIPKELIMVYPKFLEDQSALSGFDIALIKIPPSVKDFMKKNCHAVRLPFKDVFNDNHYFQHIIDLHVFGYPSHKDFSYELFASHGLKSEVLTSTESHNPGHKVMMYTNQTLPGQCGGPIICSLRNNQNNLCFFIFGIHTVTKRGKKDNIGTRITSTIYNWLRCTLMNDLARSQSLSDLNKIQNEDHDILENDVNDVIEFLSTQNKNTLQWANQELFPLLCKSLLESDRVLMELKLQEIDIGKHIGSLVNILITKSVESLSIDGSEFFMIDDSCMKKMAKAFPQTELCKLSLKNNKIKLEGARALGRVLLATNITYLDLGGNFLRVDGTIALVRSCSKLKFLGLQGNQLGNEGLKNVAQMLPTSEITDLDLTDNHIRDQGLKILAKILPQTLITNLHLGKNKFGNIGISSLARKLPNTNIIELYLQENEIQDLGVHSLFQILPDSQLEFLNLRGNYISDVMKKMLYRMEDSIELFNMYYTKVRIISDPIFDEDSSSTTQTSVVNYI